MGSLHNLNLINGDELDFDFSFSNLIGRENREIQEGRRYFFFFLFGSEGKG